MAGRFFQMVCAGLMLASGTAHAGLIYGFSGATASDGNTSGKADITVLNGELVVALTSTLDPTGYPNTSDGLEISGIEITFAGPVGSPTGFKSETGTLINIASGGGTSAGAGSIDHWGYGTSGTSFFLETVGTYAVGGKPRDLIIWNGSYSNANASITGKNPHIQGTGTFDIYISGLLAGAAISSVQLEFGTSGTDFHTASTTVVPEPWTIALIGAGLAAIGVKRRTHLR